MKKKFEIVVEYVHPGKDAMDFLRTFQDASEPFEEKPIEKEIESFVVGFVEKNTHTTGKQIFRPLIQKAWIREIYIDFDIY